MYSANYLLSQLGVSYSDCAGQAAIEQRLNDALLILGAAKAGIYRTPGFQLGGSNTPATFDPSNTLAANAALITCWAVIATGHLVESHASVDALNRWRALVGTAEFVPPSDLEILGESHESVGILVRSIQGMEVKPLVVVDPAAASVIVARSDASTPAPPPKITPVIPAQAGDEVPTGMVIPAPDGSKWIKYNTPWGSIYAKVAA